MKTQSIIMLVALLFSGSAYAGGPSYPEGYRAPTEAELSSKLRKDNKNRYSLFAANLNGDNLVDGAAIVINDKNTELAIFAFLAEDGGNKFSWYKLSSQPYESIKYAGIQLVKPGVVWYYSDITEEEKQAIDLPYNSIQCFSFEGSASIFHWDEKSNKFNQIWTKK